MDGWIKKPPAAAFFRVCFHCVFLFLFHIAFLAGSSCQQLSSSSSSIPCCSSSTMWRCSGCNIASREGRVTSGHEGVGWLTCRPFLLHSTTLASSPCVCV